MAWQPNNDISTFKWEINQNIYSRFYLEIPTKEDRYYRKTDTDIQDELRKYTHYDVICFAAETWRWGQNTNPPLPRRNIEVPTSKTVEGVRAYYRVLVQEENKYILIACHANLHGFHRGDLRFVEVNDGTILSGMPKSSVIGTLFPGDVVAVTKMGRKSKAVTIPPSVFYVHPEIDCTWEVQHMTLLPRNEKNRKVNFAVLESGVAIVEGRVEAMNVIEDCESRPSSVDKINSGDVEDETLLEVDRMYTGFGFTPEKMKVNFTEDFHRKYLLPLTDVTSRLPFYPNSLGTIYTYSFSVNQSQQFEIGVRAFKPDIFLNGTREEVVEKCVMMGAAGAQTVSNGRFDGRGFSIREVRREDLILHFSIANPIDRPTEGRWNTNNRIVIDGINVSYDAIIETVVLATNRKSIQIAARLPKDCSSHIDFRAGVWIVHQRECTGQVRFDRGFFKKMHEASNGKKVIETLYGGREIDIEDYQVREDAIFTFPSVPEIVLNEYQNQYVSMILADVPLVLGNSPFGCGKSMTIVTAAIEVHKRNNLYRKNGHHRQQLLVTQTNNACVSLIEIARKVETVHVKFLRYVSESNWKTLPEPSRTAFDLPVLMRKVFIEWATKTLDGYIDQSLPVEMKNAIVRKVTQNYMSPEGLVGEAKRIYENLTDCHKVTEPSPRILRSAFFMLYQPDIIVTTADSLPSLLHCNCLKFIANVQIDEASQLPEYTLIYLLQCFPHAGFGLVGDIKQLPPHCEKELIGYLKEYGIGNTMERALTHEMFPQSALRYVYRCHPVTTNILSDLFYNGSLISGVAENDRNEFMRMRTDIWPNQEFPILVLDHEQSGYRMGTSVANVSEKLNVLKIVRILTRELNGYALRDSDIGVISFYRAQASLLTEAFRGTNVKCGTVDAFQGTEREVMIVCCTNGKPSDFMKSPHRFNVAMSRARQATIVIGNVANLINAIYWKTIVKRARKNDCLMNISKFVDEDASDCIPPKNYYEIPPDSSDDDDDSSDDDDNFPKDDEKTFNAPEVENESRGNTETQEDDTAEDDEDEQSIVNENSDPKSKSAKRRARRFRAKQRQMEQQELVDDQNENVPKGDRQVRARRGGRHRKGGSDNKTRKDGKVGNEHDYESTRRENQRLRSMVKQMAQLLDEQNKNRSEKSSNPLERQNAQVGKLLLVCCGFTVFVLFVIVCLCRDDR
ncbi:hypothetical protein CAEBREN_03033 [Caenorhabditis brenneri]|uniref:DNA2/NAM7 helicase-like C-terminal domain-containing protein n=1 Tax=Caenorhabditis brenneri TaxID=135651 RepID=G0MS09_CAEBE|nr:hypothetical protein CAEBREN_03033 [Caenorhabditis brenneri]